MSNNQNNPSSNPGQAGRGNFYITTTLPYVNAEAHVGHALEFVRADVIARFKKLQGFSVFFNTGTDEHGIKIYNKALEAGKTPQEHVDFFATKFKELLPKLGISSDINFTRTTDAHHIESAKAFWVLCNDRGFIEKKKYTTKYCNGCELEKTDSELINGLCPDHPNMKIELIDEENYFFKFSKFAEPLSKFYLANPNFVVPETRYNEIRSFVSRGLSDFSISRLKSKMPWGIEVPNDPEQVMYVWFDALVNYIAVVGWPNDMSKFNAWWPGVQYCGKDNLRQQTAMWQAMLMAAGLPNSRQVIVNGFITGAGGIKMSKSLGNVVSPIDLLNEYGTDAVRYMMLREVHPFEDTPFTPEAIKSAYNANLANGIGNLTSRVLKMAETYGIKLTSEKISSFENLSLPENLIESVESYRLDKAMDYIWSIIGEADAYIQKEQPFKKIKVDKVAAEKDVEYLLGELLRIARYLTPFLPETSAKIITAVKEGKALATPLFMRKE